MFKLLAAAYVVGGFLTFGHVFNQNHVAPTPVVECGDEPGIIGSPEWRAYSRCERANVAAKYSGTTRFEAGFPAVYAGMFWPVYWGGWLAVEVTKPTDDSPSGVPMLGCYIVDCGPPYPVPMPSGTPQ